MISFFIKKIWKNPSPSINPLNQLGFNILLSGLKIFISIRFILGNSNIKLLDKPRLIVDFKDTIWFKPSLFFI